MPMGIQHLIVMSGSTILGPLLMGFDPNLAILFSGIGTLIFFICTAGRALPISAPRFPSLPW